MREHRPDLRVMSAGARDRALQGGRLPPEFARRVRARGRPRDPRARPHTDGDREPRHDRGLAPVLDGLDVCLVHNGSLSNHNRLRRDLRREGIAFQTENDTEVAAGYLAWRMREGASLEEALEGCLDDLDGFYTFLVGTADGFAVLRDPIACKPAVLAETDEWVAMAPSGARSRCSRAPPTRGCGSPSPGVVYAWENGWPRALWRSRAARVEIVDLATTPLRELNQRLHDLGRRGGAEALARRQPERRARGRVRPRRRARGRDRGHAGYYCAGMNKRATVRVHGNAGTGVAENMMSGPRRGRRQREPVGRRDRPRRAAGGPRRRVGPLRDLDEGDRHRRRRLGRAPERVHGPDRPARRLRRRRRGARRLDLRGAAVRARRRSPSLGADCVEKEVRDEHVEEVARAARRGPGSATPTRPRSGATARRASCTTSRSTTRGVLMADDRLHPAPGSPARVRTSSTADDRRDPARGARGASTTSAASARSAACRTSTTCSSSARRSRATRSRATASGARPTSCSARASRRSRSS